MKIKINISEGFDTWIVKEPIVLDTSLYPELKDMEDRDKILEYIQKNSHNIDYVSPDTKEPEDGWSLFDELYSQVTIREKETNYETYIDIQREEE